MAEGVLSLCSFGFVHTESLLPKGPLSRLTGLDNFISDSLNATNRPKGLLEFQVCLYFSA